jgi:lysophospholipase L1-like esterase
MRLRVTIAGAVCALAAITPASALAKTHHKTVKKPVTSYYVALGDSLARGAQPNSAGVTVATSKGYANDIYAVEKKHINGLKLEELGCLGETTSSMIEGAKSTPASPCKYSAGNQLAQAEQFIKSHKIAFVTLDIGANDIDGCVVNGSLNATCLATGAAAISANVPTIVKALRMATGAKTPIVGMTYYDPFLADYLSNSSSGSDLASESVGLAKQVNGVLSTDFAAQKVKVADVATAFDTYLPFTETETLPGVGTVPDAVGQICALTWMCAASPVGPNIHANATGYSLIAKVFEKEL